MKKRLFLAFILFISLISPVFSKNISNISIRNEKITLGKETLTEEGDINVTRVVSQTEKEDEFLVTVTSKMKSFGIESTNRPIYMVLVVDFSGSMDSYGTTLKNSIRELSSSMFNKDPNTHIAVVLFDDSAVTVLNFTNNIEDVNNMTFKSLGGGTDIVAGFKKAKTLLDDNTVPSDALKVMVLLSDGKDSNYTSTAKSYRDLGITMMSIDYSSRDDMKQVASCKDGTETCSDSEKYYYSSSVNDVATSLLKGLHDLYDRKIETKAVFQETLGDGFVFLSSNDNVTSSDGIKVNYTIDDFNEDNTYSFSYLIKLRKIKSGNFYTHTSHNNSSKIDIYDNDNNSLLKTSSFTSSSVIEIEAVKPVIKANDLVIHLGDEISNMAGVVATFNDIDITSDVTMISSNLDVNKPGVYEQTFKVVGETEEEAVTTRKVTVLIKTPDTLKNNTLLLVTGLFSLIIGCYIIYKQKIIRFNK